MKILPAMRQEFTSGMARPVATGDWTSSSPKCQHHHYQHHIIHPHRDRREHETSGNRWLLVSVFVFALGSGWGFKGHRGERDGTAPFRSPDLSTCNAVSKIAACNVWKRKLGSRLCVTQVAEFAKRLESLSINPILSFSLISIKSTVESIQLISGYYSRLFPPIFEEKRFTNQENLISSNFLSTIKG